MFLLIFISILAIVFLFLFRQGPFYLNPLWWFVFTQTLVVVGTVAVVQERNAADRL